MKPKITNTAIVHARPIRSAHRTRPAKAQEGICTAGPHGCTKTRCHCARKDRAVRGGQGQLNRNRNLE